MKDQDARRALGLVAAGAGLLLVGLLAWMRLGPSVAITPEIRVVPSAVSYAAPDLRLRDLRGDLLSLDDYRGQVVLVNLWASWCEPCMREMPAFETFYRRHASAGFAVVAVNDGESTEIVSEFVRAYDLTFPVWLDPGSIATRTAFHTVNLPSSFVIDRRGVVRLRWAGGIDLATLEESVAPLLLE